LTKCYVGRKLWSVKKQISAHVSCSPKLGNARGFLFFSCVYINIYA